MIERIVTEPREKIELLLAGEILESVDNPGWYAVYDENWNTTPFPLVEE